MVGHSVPVVNASSDTLRERLEELVAIGPTGRQEIGRASRGLSSEIDERLRRALEQRDGDVRKPQRSVGRGSVRVERDRFFQQLRGALAVGDSPPKQQVPRAEEAFVCRGVGGMFRR